MKNQKSIMDNTLTSTIVTEEEGIEIMREVFESQNTAVSIEKQQNND